MPFSTTHRALSQTISPWALAVSLLLAGCQPSVTVPTEEPAPDPVPTQTDEVAAMAAPTPTLEISADEIEPELLKSFVFVTPEGFELDIAERNLFGVGYYEFLAEAIPARIFFATGLAEFEYEGFPDKPWITGEEDWRVAAPPRDVALGGGIDVKVYRYRRVMSGRTEFVQWVFGFDGLDGVVRGAILSTSTGFTDADVRDVLAAIH